MPTADGLGDWGPADENREEPDGNHFRAPDHRSDERQLDNRHELERERQQEEDPQSRARLREEADNPALFVGDPDRDAAAAVADPEPGVRTWPGMPLYVLVPKDSPTRIWRGALPRVGVCPVHPLPPETQPEDCPCPFQAAAFPAALEMDQLLRGAWSELLVGAPDVPRRALWRSLKEHYRVVRLDMESVRVAWLVDDPVFVGGQPELVDDGKALLLKPDPATFQRLRQVVADHGAMGVIPSDPEGLGVAEWLIVFTVPTEALYKVGAVGVSEVSWTKARWWPGLRRGCRVQAARMLAWPPRGQALLSRAHFEFRMSRANRAEQRWERKQLSRATRGGSCDKRGSKGKTATERRRETREKLETLRQFAGAIEDLALAVVAVVRAVRSVVYTVVGVPVIGALVVALIRFLNG